MNFTAILLLAVVLQVSATGYTQTLTLSEKNAPLEKVFKAIEKQTGYNFFYEDKLLKGTKKIDLDVRNASLELVLEICFKDQPLKYTIVEKTIVVSPKESKPNTNDNSILSVPPPIDVHGRVLNENGDPVEGVSVKIKGSDRGTSTNANGEFTLTNVDDNAILVFTGVNIEGFEQKVNRRPDWVLNVKARITSLQEVVVNKGYYSVKQKENTGNVSIVKGETIQKQPIGDPIAALEGRVSGLFVAQNSGIPGSSMNIIRLRGQNSIANGNNPLIIVDGVPFPSVTLTSFIYGGGAAAISPFNSLNPNDIETIEVLKDADATSIYGSRGANGVILITSKTAKVDKANISIGFSKGVGHVANYMDLLETDQYLKMRHEAYRNDAQVPNSTAYDLNGVWDSTRYTDWQKTLIGGNSSITNFESSVRVGNQYTQFSLRGNYRKETTVFPGDFYDQKGSINSSLSYNSPNRKSSLVFLSGYNLDNNKIPTSDFASKITLAPDAPAIYDSNGDLNWQNSTWTNPLAIVKQSAFARTNELYGTLKVGFEILPSLSFNANLGFNNIRMSQKLIYPLSSFDPKFSTISTMRALKIATTENTNLIGEPQVEYSIKNKLGQLNCLVGTTIQEQRTQSLAISGVGFTSDNIIENLSSASSIAVADNSTSVYRYLAFYSRISYNFFSRYLVNLTGRRDGSSRFGPGKRFGNFGAVGAAWIFSNEKFLSKFSKSLSYGKIRVSYGSTGNDQLPNYQFLSTYTPDFYSYQGVTGLYPTQLTNPNFGWELVKKFEFGLELGFLNDRLHLNASYYKHRTGNQLVGYSLPSITGFSSVQANLPAKIENTGFESELSYQLVGKKSFNWYTNINLTIPRTKLVDYPNLQGSPYANRYVIGKSLLISKRFQSSGVDPQTGLYTFTDFNKDGTLSNPEDLQAIINTGQQYFGGFLNTFNFHSFQFDVFFQFVNQLGRDYLSYFVKPGQFNSNQPSLVLDRWQKPGEISSIQKFSNNNAQANTAFSRAKNSDLLYDNSSFIRLKNLSFSYLFPKALNDKLYIKEGKMFIQLQNLLTITKYKGLDPETQGLVLPPLRILTAGVKIDF